MALICTYSGQPTAHTSLQRNKCGVVKRQHIFSCSSARRLAEFPVRGISLSSDGFPKTQLKLRDYQEKCLEAVFKSHREGHKAQIVEMPTGVPGENSTYSGSQFQPGNIFLSQPADKRSTKIYTWQQRYTIPGSVLKPSMLNLTSRIRRPMFNLTSRTRRPTGLQV